MSKSNVHNEQWYDCLCLLVWDDKSFRPLRQAIPKDSYVTVAISREWELQNVNSDLAEWANNRDRLERRFESAFVGTANQANFAE